MAINKSILYSAVAVTALTTSASGVFCAKVEKTTAAIRNEYEELYQAEERADRNIASSSDPSTNIVEKAKCAAKKDSCNKKTTSDVGPTVEGIVKTTFEKCDDLFPYGNANENCRKVAQRITIAPLMSHAEEHAQCIAKAVKCYDNIKKN